MSWIKHAFRCLFECLLAPLCLLLVVLIASVLLIASSPVWKMTYQAPAQLPATAQQDGETIAANLWTSASYDEVSAGLEGRQLHAREIHHYEDLQKKFTQLSVSLAIMLLVVLAVIPHPQFKRMLWLSLAWLLILALAGTAWALYDWRDFFRTLHWWLFQNDSWKLPHRCYSLQLFPYPVWKKSMLVMLFFCISQYAFLLLLAHAFKRRAALSGCREMEG